MQTEFADTDDDGEPERVPDIYGEDEEEPEDFYDESWMSEVGLEVETLEPARRG